MSISIAVAWRRESRSRTRTRKAIAQALAGEDLRLNVTPDRRFVPILDEDDEAQDDVQPAPRIEPPKPDPETSLIECRTHERLDELRRQPYLDLTVWSPFPGWKRVGLVALVILALAARALTRGFPLLRSLALGTAAVLLIAGVVVILARDAFRRKTGRLPPKEETLTEDEFRRAEDLQAAVVDQPINASESGPT